MTWPWSVGAFCTVSRMAPTHMIDTVHTEPHLRPILSPR